MKNSHINPELLRALGSLEKNMFTAADLAEVYLHQHDGNRPTRKAARQFVYRNLERLIDARLLEKLPDNDRWPRYQKSEGFHLTSTSSEVSHLPLKNLVEKDHQGQGSSSKDFLVERLVECRFEILCAIGEAEEYQALCAALPELSSNAQALYNEARERSAILLGNVKAMESILALIPA